MNNVLLSGLLENKNSFRLMEDEFCGIATGGKENCEWDCILSSSNQKIYLNPECMLDCFNEDHCAVKALNEFIEAEGICKSCTTCEQFHNILPISPKECEYKKYINLNSSGFVPISLLDPLYAYLLNSNETFITLTSKGIFSKDTMELLSRKESCIFDIHRKSSSVYNTMQVLVTTSSNLEANQLWTYFLARYVAGLQESDFIFELKPIIGSQPIPDPFGSQPIPLNRIQPGLR